MLGLGLPLPPPGTTTMVGYEPGGPGNETRAGCHDQPVSKRRGNTGKRSKTSTMDASPKGVSL
jgi:hypothetical protein